MPLDDISTENAMQGILAKQKAAQLKEGAPNVEQRIDRLDRAIDLLVRNRAALDDAVSEDFGYQSKDVTAFAGAATSITQFKDAVQTLQASSDYQS